MRWMGLDIGDKTVGVAVSDPLFISAQGVTTIERVGIRKDAGKVLDLADQFEVEKIVAGLPLMLDGSDSPQTEKVREFVKMLQNKILSTNRKISVEFYDERFTTKIAENVMIEAGIRREHRKETIDMRAAQIILQNYMDANRNK